MWWLTSLFHNEDVLVLFIFSKLLYKLQRYNNIIGIIVNIIIKYISIYIEIFDEIDEYIINENDFCGPYSSCHILSLFIKIFIIGDNLFVITTDKKCVNHNEMDDCPIDVNSLFLKDKDIPNIIPIINVNNIIFLKKLFIKNI